MQKRQPPWVPKDGPGPRGLPDCYYVSRVLNSTFRYVKFVKKLRQSEEEERRGAESELKALRDKQSSGFFIRCDRRSLINSVARRVDLCMESYQQDLQEKRKRLSQLFAKEEESNIRKVVEQAQAGAAALWQEKVERLQYLLAKRKKEHEEKYKDTPLSKAAHVLTCICKLRAKEAEEIQLYQMKEKEARRMAEKEMDKMWHAVAMKEADALAARMEQDAIDRFRRDLECTRHSDEQLEIKRQQRQRDREMLKQETLRLKAKFDEDTRKEEEAERQRQEKRKQTALERKQTIEERQAAVAKQEADARLISDTWDSLAGQSLAADKAKVELIKRKERELDICNRRMIRLKNEVAKMETKDDHLVNAEAKRIQDAVDKKRCDYLIWSQKTNADVRKAMVEQIKDHQTTRANLQKKLDEENEYQRQVYDQMQQLVSNRELDEAKRRKECQQNLLDQIAYNKLLKLSPKEQSNLEPKPEETERARQEELDQIKKGKLAAEEYQQEIARMLSRPFFSDEVHPFMKQMAKGLKMQEKCPCSKKDYCK